MPVLRNLSLAAAVIPEFCMFFGYDDLAHIRVSNLKWQDTHWEIVLHLGIMISSGRAAGVLSPSAMARMLAHAAGQAPGGPGRSGRHFEASIFGRGDAGGCRFL